MIVQQQNNKKDGIWFYPQLHREFHCLSWKQERERSSYSLYQLKTEGFSSVIWWLQVELTAIQINSIKLQGMENETQYNRTYSPWQDVLIEALWGTRSKDCSYTTPPTSSYQTLFLISSSSLFPLCFSPVTHQ